MKALPQADKKKIQECTGSLVCITVKFERRGDSCNLAGKERKENVREGCVLLAIHVQKRSMIGYSDGPTQGNLKVLATTIDITFLH
jgi:hypothetical protein